MKPRTPFIIIAIIIVFLIIGTFAIFAESWDFFGTYIFWLVLGISILLLLIGNSLNKLIINQKFKRLSDQEKKEYLEASKVPYFVRLYKDAFKKQEDKEEEEIILDHGYDGILELDNQLPKWWLALFYFGCVFLVIYLFAFFTTDFAHPVAELDQEMEEYRKDSTEYWSMAPKITLENAEYSESMIEKGKTLFQGKCVTCHLDGGKGGIGPNLTDDYWINALAGQDDTEHGVFKNVFYMVYYGSPNDATMRNFGESGELTGKDIQAIASYVQFINQEEADAAGGQEPKGNLIENWKQQ